MQVQSRNTRRDFYIQSSGKGDGRAESDKKQNDDSSTEPVHAEKHSAYSIESQVPLGLGSDANRNPRR
jgi:hypothetical protein